MAKRKKSVMGYFKKVFAENPQWLDTPSNAAVIEMYKRDHGGKEPNGRVKQSIANTKSLLRKEMREGKSGKTSQRSVAASSDNNLSALEVSIDDCMTLAK